ncbi:MAG: ribulose-bisphosphate carboxylase large subunit family protein [Flammeovirgaceae bacterium]|nr:ribulose-bisphosphate carboxylase large subunit family protein [Flammeovirgaceae bacterium]
MEGKRIKANYLIETAFPLEKAAETMAGEQSCGTFVRTPGETQELKENHSARVESITELNYEGEPSLPGAKFPKENGKVRRGLVALSWPLENIGFHLPNLMATVAGNLFELGAFSGLKLLDFDLPDDFSQKYTGPKFGIDGTRKLTQVENRPIIGTIIKPSVGLTPEATAQQTKTLIEAGLDFLKDDELMGDAPHSPFEKRADAVMEVINCHAQKTGKKAMFAFNISGGIDEMKRRHDYVLEKGGTCVMVSINWVGISGLLKLNEFTQLPIHGHRNGWGMFTRSPILGMEFQAYQKLWRLAGVDHLHTNGIRNKFCETDESVIKSIQACLSEFIGTKNPMPVLSSGQWAGQTVDTYHAIKSTDVMYVCGGGIVAHPDGIGAGVKSLMQGWEAAINGIDLETYARDHSELKTALKFYGNLS